MLAYKVALSIHTIGFVTWFAALFYLVRLFVYHREALDKQEPEASILKNQFLIMERRLWLAIAWPGALITLIAGLALLHITQTFSQSWFQLKLFLLFVLFAYHLYCGKIRNALAIEKKRWSAAHLRLYNEAASVLLVAIIFTAVLKDIKQILFASLGFILFALFLFAVIKQINKKP